MKSRVGRGWGESGGGIFLTDFSMHPFFKVQLIFFLKRSLNWIILEEFLYVLFSTQYQIL